jgi:hypothetical protein
MHDTYLFVAYGIVTCASFHPQPAQILVCRLGTLSATLKPQSSHAQQDVQPYLGITGEGRMRYAHRFLNIQLCAMFVFRALILVVTAMTSR